MANHLPAPVGIYFQGSTCCVRFLLLEAYNLERWLIKLIFS
jgi:hypothetical protein